MKEIFFPWLTVQCGKPDQHVFLGSKMAVRDLVNLLEVAGWIGTFRAISLCVPDRVVKCRAPGLHECL